MALHDGDSTALTKQALHTASTDTERNSFAAVWWLPPKVCCTKRWHTQHTYFFPMAAALPGSRGAAPRTSCRPGSSSGGDQR
eukprot:1953365-Rhodomonas_salina.1